MATNQLHGLMIVFDSPRLVVRRLTPDDTAFIVELLNDPAFIKFIGDRGVRTATEAKAYILNGPMASYEKHGFGLFLVALKAGGIPIGICGLLKRDTLEDIDVGFAFLPQFCGKGYAFEAAAATLAYGRDILGLKRIVAITSPSNTNSSRLLEKLGLRYEKMVKLLPTAPEIKLFGLNF
jgi:RimJ/RimL family protein N-acetyltransferase